MIDTDVSIEAFVSAQQQISQMLSEIQRVTDERDALRTRLESLQNGITEARAGIVPMVLLIERPLVNYWLDHIRDAGQEAK